MSNTPTPHINANPGDFAPTVLMPGDPLRAKFIAENYLEEPVLVNNVRGVQGYTGRRNGARVSVMASGMGHLFLRAVQLLRRGADYPHRLLRRFFT